MNRYITFFNGEITHHKNSSSVLKCHKGALVYIIDWSHDSTPWRVRKEDGFDLVELIDVPPEIKTQLLLIT